MLVHNHKSIQEQQDTVISENVRDCGRVASLIKRQLTALPLVCRYEVPSLVFSVTLSSLSESSTLSKALALATGDLGEVGLA